MSDTSDTIGSKSRAPGYPWGHTVPPTREEARSVRLNRTITPSHPPSRDDDQPGRNAPTPKSANYPSSTNK